MLAQAFGLALVDFGRQPQQLLLILFNRRVPADFVPLFFQFQRRIRFNPRRRERVAAIPGHTVKSTVHTKKRWEYYMRQN